MAEKPSRRRHKTDPPPLTAREVRFCQLWVETGNATRSYIDAGFPPLAQRSTEVLASRLLRKVEVRKYIRELQQHACDAAKVTTERIVAGLLSLATYDRRKLYDEKGRIKLPHEWPDDVAVAVVGAESEEMMEPIPGAKGKKRLKGYVRKVKTADRQAAWNKLAEIKGLTGPKKDDPPAPGQKKNGTVVEVEVGPEDVEPPAESER